MINPLDNNSYESIDDFFANYANEPKEIGEQTKHDPKSSAINPSQWLDENKKFLKLDTLSNKIDLALSFFNTKKTPDIDELCQEIETRIEIKLPSPIVDLINPNSETYGIVRNKLSNKFSTNPDFKISHMSPVAGFAQSKKIAILIGDSDHADTHLQLKYYNLIKDLYSDPELALSSSLNEGQASAETTLSSIPPEFSEQQIENAVKQAKLGCESAVTYLLRKKEPKASQAFIAYTPEQFTMSEEIDASIDKLITIAAGIPSLFSASTQIEVYKSMNSTIHRIDQKIKTFKEIGMEHEFHALLAARIKKTFDSLNFDENTQRRLMTQCFELLDIYKKASQSGDQIIWERAFFKNHNVSEEQIKALLDNTKKLRQEFTKTKRNHGILKLYQELGEGLRTMRIGKAHLEEEEFGNNNLITLFENNNIPVIVIDPKS